MVFEHIEKLKKEYTDKYVKVDESQPELRRFKNDVGVVRTVNMSGRALVEFTAANNIGWYDIDVDYLKVVDKPAAKVAEKKAKPAAKAKAPAAKPPVEGKQKLSPLEMARMQGPAKKAGAAATSLAEKLEAARKPKQGGKAPAAEKPAAKSVQDRSKMSVADILAAARPCSTENSRPTLPINGISPFHCGT